MSKQYFENNPELSSKPFYISFYFRKNNLKFKSDNGVFSKRAVDFGSNLLLKSVEVLEDDSILDVGCGIGIIGITLAKCNPSSFVEMIDVNKRAMELARNNCLENNVKNALVFESNTYENVEKKYSLIISNPPIRAGKKVVHDILLNSIKYLKENGRMYCVIQKKQGAESALRALKEVFPKVEVIEKDNGYYIIKCTK
ncbi:MAG: class I SAM-dependent methyltransferase [Bacilli bacterium]|nr:class I SAM-dependent methyltransferase [Bacilli bacterium]